MKPFALLAALLFSGAPSARGEVDLEKLHNDYETNLRLASRHPFRDFDKAVDANDLPAVRRFLDQGLPASLQIPTPEEEWEGIPPSEQAIHLAARRGHLAMVKLLLDRGASPDARDSWGTTPLFQASDPAIARLLIARGAKISARESDGIQPIHRAATRSLKLVKLLVRHGADPLARDQRGGRPLHDAARDGTLEIASYLFGRGSPVGGAIADPEDYFRNGWQALHFAAAREESPDALAIAALLLRKGAAVNATTREGETAHTLDQARRQGDLSMIRKIRLALQGERPVRPPAHRR